MFELGRKLRVRSSGACYTPVAGGQGAKWGNWKLGECDDWVCHDDEEREVVKEDWWMLQ